jgi:hypothetical protein
MLCNCEGGQTLSDYHWLWVDVNHAEALSQRKKGNAVMCSTQKLGIVISFAVSTSKFNRGNSYVQFRS